MKELWLYRHKAVQRLYDISFDRTNKSYAIFHLQSSVKQLHLNFFFLTDRISMPLHHILPPIETGNCLFQMESLSHNLNYNGTQLFLQKDVKPSEKFVLHFIMTVYSG